MLVMLALEGDAANAWLLISAKLETINNVFMVFPY